MARYSYRYDEWFLTETEIEEMERLYADLLDEDAEYRDSPFGYCSDPDCDGCTLAAVAGEPYACPNRRITA